MVRTKGDGAMTKVVGAKAPRKQLVSHTGASSSAHNSQSDSNKKGKPASGLPYCPQPTPEWQKSVKSFFKFTPAKTSEEETTDKPSEDKENKEEHKVEIEDSPEKSKGKQPKKGKRTKKGSSSTKKSSKKNEDNPPSEEVNSNSEEKMDDADVTHEQKTVDVEEASAKEDNSDSRDNDSNDLEEPVKKKRNRIIESDDED